MIRKYCVVGDRLPAGYRPAWNDFLERRVVCYPFGLHWFAMFVRRIWELSYWYPPSRLEKLIQEHRNHAAELERGYWRDRERTREAAEKEAEDSFRHLYSSVFEKDNE